MVLKYIHIAKGVMNIRALDEYKVLTSRFMRVETIHSVNIRESLLGRYLWLCEKPVYQSDPYGQMVWINGKVWTYDVAPDCDVDAIATAILSTPADETFTWPPSPGPL
jgi:hypothetical protein